MTVRLPGMLIENSASEVGSLGCFAKVNGTSDIVLLSNAHVLFASVRDSTSVKIYEPPSCSSCCRNDHIGTTLLDWASGFRHVEVKLSNNQPSSGYETDCAIAKLEAGILYSNTIPGIGMIAGTVTGSDLGVTKGPDFGNLWTDDNVVRMYSPMLGRVVYGTVLHTGMTATYTSGGSGAVPALLTAERIANTEPLSDAPDLPIDAMMILPRPSLVGVPATATIADLYRPYVTGTPLLQFGLRGDSGSVVVNKDNKVIGQYHFVGLKPSTSLTAVEWLSAGNVGYVSPISRVLTQLADAGKAISIDANMANATPSAGELVAPELYARGLDRLYRALQDSPFGRVLLAKIEQHRREARTIVIGGRRGVVTWHRNMGPAYAKHIVDALENRAHVIPDRINGVGRLALLDVLADLLEQYGSPALREDVIAHRELSRTLVTQLRTLDDVVAFAERHGG
ncbi:MAG: hypothetical protein ABI867_11060 [Kofleriaceae bacterium]